MKKVIKFALGFFCFCFIVSIYVIAETLFHGPYVSYFNNKMEEKARSVRLIGKSESEVLSVFGHPTSTYLTLAGTPMILDFNKKIIRRYNHEEKTLNYAPFSFFPFAKFQVHLTDGIVSGLEKFDD